MKVKVVSAVALAWAAVTVQAHGNHRGHEQKVFKVPSNFIEPLVTDGGALNADAIAAQLQECKVVQDVNKLLETQHAGDAHAHHDTLAASVISAISSKVFAYGPGVNAILAATYVTGIPSVILLSLTPTIKPSILPILTAFAAGSLLGDIFFHLLPEVFVGHSHSDGLNLLIVDNRRTAVLALGLFVGFIFFISLDKILRVVSIGDGHSHGHSHSHSHSHTHRDGAPSEFSTQNRAVLSTGADQEPGSEKSTLTQRSKSPKNAAAGTAATTAATTAEASLDKHGPTTSAKVAAYLNIIADFAHNLIDGVALTASFYVDHTIGVTTFVAVLLHEVPHQFGDFALLIQGGFSKKHAQKAQAVAAAGLYLGTFIGIAVRTFPLGSIFGQSPSSGLFGSSVGAGDLVLPLTTGAFLYIATVGVLPEILETGSDLPRHQKIKQSIGQFSALLAGVGIMFLISLAE